MKNMYLIVLFSVLTVSLCFYTREEYEEIQSIASYEMMDYDIFLEQFGNKDFKTLIKAGQESHENETASMKSFNFYDKSFLENIEFNAALPINYDWRQILPKCFVDKIGNQLNCGGCWAFSTATAYAFRLCKKYNSSFTSLMSMQYMLSCDFTNNACQGGNRYKAWQFLQQTGTVTDYCVPFTSGENIVPSCPTECTKKDFSFVLARSSNKEVRFFNPGDIEKIKQEIFLNGPVTAGMLTYKDFPSYKGGIYRPATAETGERHAIIIVGWGREGSTDYWIIQNSWGPLWGEKGHFRIPLDVCEISNMIIVGDV